MLNNDKEPSKAFSILHRGHSVNETLKFCRWVPNLQSGILGDLDGRIRLRGQNYQPLSRRVKALKTCFKCLMDILYSTSRPSGCLNAQVTHIIASGYTSRLSATTLAPNKLSTSQSLECRFRDSKTQ